MLNYVTIISRLSRLSRFLATAVCEFRNLTENLVICLRLFIEFYNNALRRQAASASPLQKEIGSVCSGERVREAMRGREGDSARAKESGRERRRFVYILLLITN